MKWTDVVMFGRCDPGCLPFGVVDGGPGHCSGKLPRGRRDAECLHRQKPSHRRPERHGRQSGTAETSVCDPGETGQE